MTGAAVVTEAVVVTGAAVVTGAVVVTGAAVVAGSSDVVPSPVVVSSVGPEVVTVVALEESVHLKRIIIILRCIYNQGPYLNPPAFLLLFARKDM